MVLAASAQPSATEMFALSPLSNSLATYEVNREVKGVTLALVALESAYQGKKYNLKGESTTP